VILVSAAAIEHRGGPAGILDAEAAETGAARFRIDPANRAKFAGFLPFCYHHHSCVITP